MYRSGSRLRRRGSERMTEGEKQALERTPIDWLPARDFTYDPQGFKRALMLYKDIGVEDLRANLIAFVRDIASVAEEEGARLAIHPDDPAFPIFGLPRVLSTAEDVRKLFAAVQGLRAHPLRRLVRLEPG